MVTPTMELLKKKESSDAVKKLAAAKAHTCSPPPSDAGPPEKVPADSAADAKKKVSKSDPLQDAAHEIENLKNEAAALAMLRDLTDERGMSEFQLGGVLTVIRAHKWYTGHATFAKFCEHQLGFRLRKAEYLMKIYHFVVEAEVSVQQVEKVHWTKLRVIAQCVDPKAAPEWLEKAQPLTVRQLEEALKGTLGSKDDGPAGEVTTMTFKFHKDQRETVEAAIEKAKAVSGTEVASAAMEYICLDFLPSPKAKKADGEMPPIKDVYEAIKAKHGDDLTEALKEIFGAFESVYPNVDITVALAKEAG